MLKKLIADPLRAAIPKRILPSSLLRAWVQRRTERRVLGGPFRGMFYTDVSLCGAYIPKLLGTYEQEIHHIVESIVARAPDAVVDIGGAEGYYAVGLLCRLPESKMTVFEQVADGRRLIAELGRANGVEGRLSIEGTCDHLALKACLDSTKAAVIISDVEGYELTLLDPLKVPRLAETFILVEVHDSKAPNCAALLAERFRSTHRVTRIAQEARTMRDYPLKDASRFFGPVVKRYGLSEFRSPETAWLWLEPFRH